MTDLVVTMGLGHYDHVMDLASGAVRCEGVRIRHLDLPVEEVFHRFIKYREWDVSEISLAKFSALVSQGDTSLVGIPVFPSRMFRHSSAYVLASSGIRTPGDLAGRRVGVPEWAQTAAVYSRGLLTHGYGVALEDVAWFQAGVNEPGRAEKVRVSPPDGVELTRVADRSLSGMLLDGELDAVLSAHPPRCFEEDPGRVVRLFRDAGAAEAAYWRETGVFPIMHMVVVRADVVERHPWLPTTLLKGFEQAKERSVERLTNMSASLYPVPWLQDYTAVTTAGFGADGPWPYGVAANRHTLATFLRYAHEQGVLQRALEPEELFWPSTLDTVRI
ncbi:ABC transporter substrate-binding protein [Streptomyces sp. NPDC050560]|uniref:ABC transporter substrate-binding protein n=1 Tax=Streptomyces sp. NPDC050560 TaxID=3365630 RepID=UPI0037AC7A24